MRNEPGVLDDPNLNSWEQGPEVAPARRRPPDEITLDPREIRSLAYRYWLERGRPWGSPEVDWFRAESELKARALTGTAPLPAVSLDDARSSSSRA